MKRALKDNGSPKLFYKIFDIMDNVTSEVIPVNEEYQEIKNETKPNKKLGIESQTQIIKQKILGSDYTKTTKMSLYIYLPESYISFCFHSSFIHIFPEIFQNSTCLM